jgi:AcrR family transcriptional regulator
MPKTDRRINRTRRQLADAFIQLCLERDYEQLTLRDLTERADIGYATFFRHYSDKESLLNAILEESISTLISSVNALSDQPELMMTTLFKQLLEQPERYQMLVKTRHISHLLERVMTIGSAMFIEQFAHQLKANIPPDLAARHVIGAVINLIEWWLEPSNRIDPKRMGELINSLIMQPLKDHPALET